MAENFVEFRHPPVLLATTITIARITVTYTMASQAAQASLALTRIAVVFLWGIGRIPGGMGRRLTSQAL
jgi:hypothetical protein